MVSSSGVPSYQPAVAYQGGVNEAQFQEAKVNEAQPKQAPAPTANSSDEQRGGSDERSSASGGRGGHVDVKA